MKEVIVAEGLLKKFGKVVALNDVSLKISSGNCVGLLGPNGAGKSTFIKILCGLLRPNSGRAYVNGFDPFYSRKEALEGVGCLVEEPSLYGPLDPVTYLRYLGEVRGMGGPELEMRIREVLELTDLMKWSKTKLGRFSRGMRQKMVFAQAILHDPPVLIFDEPGLGLDPRAVFKIRDYINRARRAGKTIFLSSHMLLEVQETCNKVALISKGHLLKIGDARVLEKMFTPRVLEVEVLKSPSPKQIKKIKNIGAVESLSLDKGALKIGFKGGKNERARLLESLINNVGLKVVSYKTPTLPLEDVYLQLVGE
ncbi:MAG: ABC transporter ATP-binding protein [Candidatus Hadarchaeota archaeon]